MTTTSRPSFVTFLALDIYELELGPDRIESSRWHAPKPKPVKAPKLPSTIKIYDGPSLLDGKRIIVLVSGIVNRTGNRKTGDMLQTWILLYDTPPHVAQRNGTDVSVCGRCPLRPIHYRERGHRRPCYVATGKGVRSTWEANRDRAVSSSDEIRRASRGRLVRRGSYGDPAAVPAWVWSQLDSVDDPSTDRRATGYNHQWIDIDDETRTEELARRTMASVHGLDEAAVAWAKGYRTFRVLEPGEAYDSKREILCPASKEAGARTTCDRCGLCNGSTGPNDRRKNIAIVGH